MTVARPFFLEGEKRMAGRILAPNRAMILKLWGLTVRGRASLFLYFLSLFNHILYTCQKKQKEVVYTGF